MGSIFRITKAEFIKTFKRPTVYIMAVVLLLVAIVSAILFSPSSRTDDRINYTQATSASEVLTMFNTSTTYGKPAFDSTVTKANNKILYYNNMYIRANYITKAYNNVIKCYEDIKTGNKHYQDFQEMLMLYKDEINNKHDLDGVEFINDSYNLEFYKAYGEYIDSYYSQCTSDSAIINGFYNEDETHVSPATRLLNIKNNSIDIIKETINYYLDKANESFAKYYSLYVIGFKNTPEDITKQNKYLTEISSSVTSIYTYIHDKLYSQEYSAITLSITDYKALENIESYYVNTLIKGITSSTSWSTTRYVNLIEVAKSTTLKDIAKIQNRVNVVTLDTPTLTDLTTLSKTIDKDLTNIYESMTSMDVANTSKDVMMAKVSDYYMLSQDYSAAVDDYLLLYKTKGLTNAQINSLNGKEYEDYNYYRINERLSLNLYKINNNISGQYYLNSLSYNTNSGYNTNGYDYMFFTLSIMTVIIVIFAIMMTAISIGSEQDSGTIKFLLVRPFTRTQILIAKILSVFFFIFIFSILAFVISLIAGLAIYGLPNISVLAVFNSTSVFSMHPLLLLIIYLLTIVLHTCFYSSFALMLAVVFKNFAAGLVSSLIVYLGGITCNVLLSGKLACKWIPFTNSYLFRYFGGSFVKNASELTYIFTTPVSSNMGFVWSILYILLVMIILNTISLLVFSKRDY